MTLPSSGLQPRGFDTRRPWCFVKLVGPQSADWPGSRLRLIPLQTPDGKSLLWLDSATRSDDEPSLDPAACKRLELSSVTEVKPQTSHPASTPQQAIPSQISLSLMSGAATSLLDLVATDNDQFAEWSVCTLVPNGLFTDGPATGLTDCGSCSTMRPSLNRR